MKDIYKNPIFYYILVPCLAALWPLLVWAVYSPAVERNLQDDREQYKLAEAKIMGI